MLSLRNSGISAWCGTSTTLAAGALECEVVRLIRPALDLDVPADLIEFVRTPTMTHTFGHLTRLGLLHG